MIYELTFLMPPLVEKEKNEVLQKILEEIKRRGGDLKEESVEKRSFVYPVKKNENGFISTIIFSISKNSLHNINDFIRKEERVLRSVIIKREIFEKEKRAKRHKRPTIKTKPTPKREKVKLEDMDKRLEEILK